ncbi:hypothetical protein Tco_0530991 [Tanacetum coccineum]
MRIQKLPKKLGHLIYPWPYGIEQETDFSLLSKSGVSATFETAPVVEADHFAIRGGYVFEFASEGFVSHKFNVIDEPTDDESDNDNIIGEVTNDAQDPVNNQASDGVDNFEALYAESTVDVEDYDNFIDEEAVVDETTHDEYRQRF